IKSHHTTTGCDTKYPLTIKNSPPILPAVKSNALSIAFQTLLCLASQRNHVPLKFMVKPESTG
ncbi:hypothetical protein KJ590_04550, partial [Patescibacteria group bacterium]|nr:hypothetical protein [Patescibacteria group bacterium]